MIIRNSTQAVAAHAERLLMMNRIMPLSIFVVMCFSAKGDIPQREVDALADFFTALHFHNTTPVSAHNACTNWPMRIVCDATSQSVTQLYFSNASLNGTLPASCANLSSLQSFSVAGNNISGTLPPEWSRWGALLVTFDASQNRLSGMLPKEYAAWTFVRTLNVSSNQFDGTIPTEYKTMAHLEGFSVAFNALTGTLPPEFSSWARLSAFQCKSNALSGTLPSEYSNMTQMNVLDVHNNTFSGTLPPSYASFFRLALFDVSSNSLTGTLPEEYNFAMLDQFSCSNNSLSGTLPASYGDMRFREFRVASNFLIGSLPPEYSRWGTRILIFTASENKLSGTIPSSYASWGSLQQFEVKNNSLFGTLPPEFYRWSLLQRFDISLNRITGNLPPSYLWSNVEYFLGTNNELVGTLPDSYAQWRSVNQITLSHNNLTGSIPISWGSTMSSLRLLALSDNSLTGTLPSFTSLLVLSVSHNQLSGTIPPLGFLILLDVQNNTNISGTLPSSFVLRIATACGTGLGGPNPGIATICCIPTGVIDGMLSVSANQFPAAFTSKAEQYPYTFSTPAPPSPPPPSTVPVQLLPGNWNNAVTATTVVATASVAIAAIMGVDVSSMQILASVLGSPCTCSSTQEESDSSLMHLALSPFSSLGFAWAAIGNTLLCVFAASIHTALVMRSEKRSSREVRGSLTSIKHHMSPNDAAIATDRWLRGHAHRRHTIGTLQFPNLTVRFVMTLLPGIVRGICGVASEIGSDLTALNITSLTIGVVWILGSYAVLELLVYRHINKEYTTTNDATGGYLRYTTYTHVARCFAPVPKRIAQVVLPQGAWGPHESKRAYGGLVSSFSGRHRGAWRVVPLLNVVIQILSAIDAHCHLTQGLMMALLIAVSCFCVALRPWRALLVSYLSGVSHALNAVLVALALLCRLDLVTANTVSTVGVVVSIVLMVCKAYTSALPYAEQWLLKRNSPVELQVADSADHRAGDAQLSLAKLRDAPLQTRPPNSIVLAAMSTQRSAYQLSELIGNTYTPLEALATIIQLIAMSGRTVDSHVTTATRR